MLDCLAYNNNNFILNLVGVCYMDLYATCILIINQIHPNLRDFTSLNTTFPHIILNFPVPLSLSTDSLLLLRKWQGVLLLLDCLAYLPFIFWKNCKVFFSGDICDKTFKMHLLWHLLLNYISLFMSKRRMITIPFPIVNIFQLGLIFFWRFFLHYFIWFWILVKCTESCLACHTNLSKQGHQTVVINFSFVTITHLSHFTCWAVFAITLPIMLVGYNLYRFPGYLAHLTGEVWDINCWLSIFDLDRGGYKLSWRVRQMKRQARISLKLGLCMGWSVIFPSLHSMLHIDHNLLVFCRNKDIANVLTIDLHGQHVKQAMRVLKLHLLFGKYVRCKHLPYFYADLTWYSILLYVMNIYGLVPAIQTLRVITGCGSHGLGKSKVKQAVCTPTIPLPANLLSYIGKLAS